MYEFWKNLILQKSLLSYTIIGVSNTFFTLILEFVLINLFHLPYWWATSIPFAITSITSFVFNRRFSFHSKGNLWIDGIKFYTLFAACYILAFKLAKPAAIAFLEDIRASETTINNVSVVIGQCIFTPLNYFGQRFLVYRTKNKPSQPEGETADD